MTVSAVLSLLNLASVGVFGIVLSAAFCDLEWTRQRKGILAVSTVLMLALQAVVSLHWGTGLARYLYPVITHLPLFLLLTVLTGKWLWPLVAVLTAYLCCQLRRWAALLVIALFPAGGTVLHGKGTGGKEEKAFYNVSIADEKEVILIVSRALQKSDIMRAIIENAGPSTEAGAIVFSLPASEVAGFGMFEDTSGEEK